MVDVAEYSKKIKDFTFNLHRSQLFKHPTGSSFYTFLGVHMHFSFYFSVLLASLGYLTLSYAQDPTSFSSPQHSTPNTHTFDQATSTQCESKSKSESKSKNQARTCLGLPKISASSQATLKGKNMTQHTPAPSSKESPRGALNLLGTPLKQCCTSPMTGYERDGFCHTQARDRGLHVVCAEISQEFLDFTKAKGNDLSSPAPLYGFPGLKPGDRWCLCAARWLEAHRAGVAPLIDLEASEQSALKLAPLELYQEYDFSKRPTISSPPKANKWVLSSSGKGATHGL